MSKEKDIFCRLTLVGEVNNWEYFSRRKQSPKYRKIKMMVCEKHHHKCKFCGYQGDNLEIVNLNHDFKDNAINNLVPACFFCMKPQLLDSYSIDYEGGDRMIFLPDMTQTELSHLYRVLFYALAKGGDYAYGAQMLYSQLKDQATYLDEKMGTDLSHPAQFVYYLKSPKADSELVSKIRWLPEADLDEYASMASGLVEEFDLMRDAVDRLSKRKS
jgi:intracellular multiplication protein IcmJ